MGQSYDHLSLEDRCAIARLQSEGRSIRQIAAALRDFLAPPVVRLLAETDRHMALLEQVLAETRVTGNLVHDAHLVALAVEHGVHEILTLDGDFARFKQVASRNPFI